MATFQQWLTGHEDDPADSPIGWLARQWKALEGDRPRVSSPTGIEKHLISRAPAEQPAGDQWTGYVHQAVAAATAEYKTDKMREQSTGSTVSSSEQIAHAGPVQPEIPGVAPAGAINPATGKPPAVISSSQWVEYPDASRFGSCPQEGWAYGVANLDGHRALTCSAGHVVNATAHLAEVPTGDHPEPPPLPTGLTEQAAGDVASYETHPAQPPAGPATTESMQAVAGLAQAAIAMSLPDPSQDEPLTDSEMIELVNLKLDAILVALGLPTDAEALVGLLGQAVTAEASAPAGEVMLSAQLRGQSGELAAIPPEVGSGASGQPVPSWTTPNGGMPASFAHWYGVADPAGE